MKQLLIGFFLFLFVQTSFAQTDSSALNAGSFTTQARDAEYLSSVLSKNEGLDVIFDELKTKFRTTTPPSGNTAITLTTLTNASLIALFSEIRNPMTGILPDVFGRIDAAIRNTQSKYVQFRISMLDANMTKQYGEQRKQGRMRLKGKAD